jgi:elongation factor 1-gamma
MGILQFNRNTNERAKDELKHILQLLDNYLRTRTYLVGERITLADITIACDLLLLFQWVKNKNMKSKILKFSRCRLLNQVYVKRILM